jgi:hypothetical protein
MGRFALLGLVILAGSVRAAVPSILTWDAVTTNVDGSAVVNLITYRVYSTFEDAMGNGTSPIVVLAEGLTALTYIDSRPTLLPGLHVCYRVSAIEVGLESYPSTASTACKTIRKRHASPAKRRHRAAGRLGG